MASLKQQLAMFASATAMMTATPALAQQSQAQSANPVSNSQAQSAAAANASPVTTVNNTDTNQLSAAQSTVVTGNNNGGQAASAASVSTRTPGVVLGVGVDAASLARFVFNGEQLGQVCRVNGDVAAGKDPMLSGPKAVTLRVQGGERGEMATTFVCQQTALLAFARDEMRAGRLHGDDAVKLIAAITGGTVVVNNNTQGVAAQPAVPFMGQPAPQERVVPLDLSTPQAKVRTRATVHAPMPRHPAPTPRRVTRRAKKPCSGTPVLGS